jgi:hypothetical protein
LTARGCNFKRVLGGLLTAHIAEVDAEVLKFAEEFLCVDFVGLALNDADDGCVQKLNDIEER